jgi:hypothetical protein
MTNKSNTGAAVNGAWKPFMWVRFVDDTPKPTIEPPPPKTCYYGQVRHEFTFKERADILKRQYPNVWARYHKKTIVEPPIHYPCRTELE